MALGYASSTRQFLTTAERRYRFMRLRDYVVAGIGCLLLGIAAGPHVVNLMTQRYFGPEHRTLIIVCYCVLYVSLCVMGFVFTYKNWKRDKRPLWLAVRQTLTDLTAEEDAGTHASADTESSRS